MNEKANPVLIRMRTSVLGVVALSGCIYINVPPKQGGDEYGEDSDTDSGSDSDSGSNSGEGSGGEASSSDPSIECAVLPMAALGADYAYSPQTTGELSGWTAEGLPPGVGVDPDTGALSGVVGGPTQIEYGEVRLAAIDEDMNLFEAECGPLVVNPRLSISLEALGPETCLPHAASAEELFALFDGGDGSPLNCVAPSSTGDACPLGHGRGKLPPGVDYDPGSCTHSGLIDEDVRGTFVWMIEVEQSGAGVLVPICASRDIDTHHDVISTVFGVPSDDMQPWILEHDPVDGVELPEGERTFEMIDPGCEDNPSDCNYFGYRWTRTCSPTLEPMLDASSLPHGVRYSLSSPGKTPEGSHGALPSVTSIEISTCTSANAGDCGGDLFDQNAQTRYHLSIISQPSAG